LPAGLTTLKFNKTLAPNASPKYSYFLPNGFQCNTAPSFLKSDKAVLQLSAHITRCHLANSFQLGLLSINQELINITKIAIRLFVSGEFFQPQPLAMAVAVVSTGIFVLISNVGMTKAVASGSRVRRSKMLILKIGLYTDLCLYHA